MRTAVKKILDSIFHPFGLKIERYFGDELPLKKLVKIAEEHNIDLLLDVGANTGQFVIKMMEAGYKKSIISFEPLSSAYPTLQKHAQQHPQWKVYERSAIGDFDGTIDINISMNSHSSSILPISKIHTDAAPSAAFVSKEVVSIKQLDTIAGEFGNYKNILLKIDTQGFEKNVLDGASALLQDKVKIIQLEMSLLPLYEGCATYEALTSMLHKQNFVPLFFTPGYIDRTSDQLQQVEGYFIKNNL